MTRDVVLEHLAAFNAHDTERLLETLADDVEWRTGTDLFACAEVLRRNLFDDGLWSLAPSLTLRMLVVEESTAAALLTERLTLDGVEQSFDIAVFFTVTDDQISAVTVFREGNADLAR